MKSKLQFSACETQVKTWAEGNDDHEAEVEKPENSSACLSFQMTTKSSLALRHPSQDPDLALEPNCQSLQNLCKITVLADKQETENN